MNRIDTVFRNARRTGRKALIGYVTAGFPDKKGFLRLIPPLQQAGLDLLEIGIPFSDPIADGPTIQQASQRALQKGVTLGWVLRSVRELRKKIQLPVVLMSYSNPILAMGLNRFFSRAREAGVDGLIVPDLIPEEGRGFEKAAAREGLHLIYLAAPTTPEARLRKIAQASRGFVYAVALAGVTGARQGLPPGLKSFLARLHRATSKPVAVGFGFSTPQQVRSVRNDVDGVIVGSALINAIARSGGSFRQATAFVAALQHGLNSGIRDQGSGVRQTPDRRPLMPSRS